jgi:hypothetical protein
MVSMGGTAHCGPPYSERDAQRFGPCPAVCTWLLSDHRA